VGWFTRRPKNSHRYLTDTSDWHFGALYKHDINLAIAKCGQSRLFEIRQDQLLSRRLGEWVARGLVHFEREGPLIPFELSIGDRSHSDDDDGLGRFVVQRIQPYDDANFPEDHKASFLRLEIYIADHEGMIVSELEKAMLYAATSRKGFFHVRIGKAAFDPELAAAQIQEKQYTDSNPITTIVIADTVHLNAPSVALAREDL
jgi:hypothetical protein